MKCIGQLYVKSNNMIKDLLSGTSQAYSKRLASINFGKARITILNEDLIKNKDKDLKVFHFVELIEVTKEDISQHTRDLKAPWPFKFTISFTNHDSIECYSRTVDERSLWIQSFCRVIDYNKG